MATNETTTAPAGAMSTEQRDSMQDQMTAIGKVQSLLSGIQAMASADRGDIVNVAIVANDMLEALFNQIDRQLTVEVAHG